MHILLLLAGLLLSAPAFAVKKTSVIDSYDVTLKETISGINGKMTTENVAKKAKKLVELSKEILSLFAKKDKACETYINTALKAGQNMLAMPLDEIELNYHQDKALPKAPESCHHAKDLLVHPATVYILATKHSTEKDARNKMFMELAELSAHLIYTKEQIEKK